MKHYKFGSSTAARTDACPPWVSECASLPPGKESAYAATGTAIHAMLEARGLDDDYQFPDQLGKTVEGVEVDADMIEMAEDMWSATEALMDQYDIGEFVPECTGEAAADVGGTLDFVGDGREVCVLVDYKTGQGVQVSPVNNKQILFAAAVCEMESIAADIITKHDNFVGVIIQPDSAGNVQVKSWEFTRDQVDAFWDSHVENIASARAGEGELCAGDHCKFCPANGLCAVTSGALHRMAVLDPEDMDQLVEGLGMIEQVKETIRALEKRAYEQLEIGATVPGWKLVPKRASRKWSMNDDQIIARLRRKLGGKKHIVKEVLLSPAQMEKVAKSQGLALDLEELTVKESSGSTLAPDSDPRDAVLSHDGLAAGLAAIKA